MLSELSLVKTSCYGGSVGSRETLHSRHLWGGGVLIFSGDDLGKGKNRACLGKSNPVSSCYSHSSGCMTSFSVKWRQWGPGEVTQWVKVLAAESDDLISIPELHMVERAYCHKLSSDFCMSAMAFA